MDDDNIQTNNCADVAIAISLPIPQGDILQLQVEQSHYTFYLNQQIVEQIQQAKDTGTSLEIPLKLFLSLWYYTCFSYNFVPVSEGKEITNKPVTKSYTIFVVNILKAFWNKSLLNNTSLPAGFTFTSCYQQGQFSSADDHQQGFVLQSVVLFHGDILHKIKQEFLQYNLDCHKIISAHYWLTEQILGALRSRLNLLVWELSSLVTGFLFTDNLFDLNIPYLQNNTIFFIVIWLVLTISLASARYLFAKQLRGFNSIKHQYLNWFSWGITCIIPIFFFTSFSISRGIIPLITVLLPLIALFMPLIAQRSLIFILPRLGRFVVRRLL